MHYTYGPADAILPVVAFGKQIKSSSKGKFIWVVQILKVAGLKFLIKYLPILTNQKANKILDRYLPYEAGAEIWFEDTKISFWD